MGEGAVSAGGEGGVGGEGERPVFLFHEAVGEAKAAVDGGCGAEVGGADAGGFVAVGGVEGEVEEATVLIV